MALSRQNAVVGLGSLTSAAAPTLAPDFEPVCQAYIWPLVFKIDGTTVVLDGGVGTLNPILDASGVPGPGAEYYDLGSISLGNIAIGSTLDLSSIVSMPDLSVEPIRFSGGTPATGGQVGIVYIIWDADLFFTNAARAAGQRAFVSAVTRSIGGIIPTLGVTKPSVTQEDQDAMSVSIRDAVKRAIEGAMNPGDVINSIFNGDPMNQDDVLASGVFIFAQEEFSELPIGQRVQKFNTSLSSDHESTWTLEGFAVRKRVRLCFVATASLGSNDPRAIEHLVWFRDTVLKKNVLGRYFIFFYYRYSPPLAEWISESRRRQAVVYHLLISPVARLIHFFRAIRL